MANKHLLSSAGVMAITSASFAITEPCALNFEVPPQCWRPQVSTFSPEPSLLQRFAIEIGQLVESMPERWLYEFTSDVAEAIRANDAQAVETVLDDWVATIELHLDEERRATVLANWDGPFKHISLT